MPVSLASLQKLATLNLSSEQMAGVIDVLTVELAPMERTKALAEQRQQRFKQRCGNVATTSQQRCGNVAPTLQQRCGNVAPTLFARVEDNTLPSSTSGFKEGKKDISSGPSSKPSDPGGFAEFWVTYPKRAGDADRKSAAKAFLAALKRIDILTLLDGARRYAVHCDASDKTGTEFVRQARTWLNADGWTETYGTASHSSGPGPQRPNSIRDSYAIVKAGLQERVALERGMGAASDGTGGSDASHISGFSQDHASDHGGSARKAGEPRS